MGAIPVVGADDLGQDGVEVVVVQRDDVVEALAPEGSDHSFGDGIGNRFQLHAIGTVVDDFASFTPTTR